jgi:hypothetical protein
MNMSDCPRCSEGHHDTPEIIIQEGEDKGKLYCPCCMTIFGAKTPEDDAKDFD